MANIRERLQKAVPSGRTALLGSLGWAFAMAASAGLAAALAGWHSPVLYLKLCVLFALGGAVSFVPALYTARLISVSGSRETAFASALLSFALFTISATALGYALHYRIYYSQWHSDPFTVQWAYQLAFTGLASLYQFGALGVRLYLPLGLPVLFVVSYRHAAGLR